MNINFGEGNTVFEFKFNKRSSINGSREREKKREKREKNRKS